MKKNKILNIALICLLLIFCASLSGCFPFPSQSPLILLDNIPEFDNSPYVVINNNEPYFTEDEITDKSFEYYGELDFLGRCTEAFACIGTDIMPTEERGSIGQIKPSGWQSVKYDFVDGKYLYNRCHLIAYQLAGENANEKNLITGTRYMNTTGMIPFENMVADYVKETDNHVMYRVTPIFKGNELVARGVLMEALSVEDNGDGVCFNVFVYNCQPKVIINYSDGTSTLEEVSSPDDSPEITYILNINTKKFHTSDCPLAEDIKESNKQVFTGNREYLISNGYSPCKNCCP